MIAPVLKPRTTKSSDSTISNPKKILIGFETRLGLLKIGFLLL
jgi:hypothetical protein